MMYTSLNAGRQSWLSPFIQTSYEPLLSDTYFHLCAQRTNMCSVHANGKPLYVILSVFVNLHSSVIYHPTSKGVQGIMLTCRCTHTKVCMQSFILSLSISFAFNIHSACGQWALLCIRSASSNSEGHQRNSNAIVCVTMRWRGQWKTVMNISSVKAYWALLG